ncbi:hypothetical protein [Campylobacter concisus]|uniref:hypothetical protein n=1 Tax=Campylobacter concisus TaxID=199 RepID=UPI00122C778F|nr:hypothetical protein [Campylobacter concisus]
MKTKMLLFSICLASASILNATESPALKDITEIQNFYYQKGYNDASEKFYKAGYEKAVLDLIRQTQKYRSIIDSYEAGKYYMESNKITFPRVYRTRNAEGQYIIQMEAPEVKERLSIEDIFILPEIEQASQTNYNTINGNNNGVVAPYNPSEIGAGSQTQQPLYNSILPVADNSIEATSPISIMKESSQTFPKTERIKRVLDASGMKYAETPSGYKTYFKNETDYKTFCKSISGDERCSSLLQK